MKIISGPPLSLHVIYSFTKCLFVFGNIRKSAVFLLADQVHSTVWDRWTAQGNSFLQVLCHLLPGGDFNGVDNWRAGNPPHFYKNYKNTKLRYALPLIKCLKGTPPACNVSSHHLSLKFYSIFTQCTCVVWPWFTWQCVRSWAFGMQGCDSWPHWLSVREMPPRHYRCVFYLESSINPLFLQLHRWMLPLGTSKPFLSCILKQIETGSYELLKCLIDVRFSLYCAAFFALLCGNSALCWYGDGHHCGEYLYCQRGEGEKCSCTFLWNIYMYAYF